MDAINIVKNVILENNIDCNLDCQDSFLFTNYKDNISKIEDEKKVLCNNAKESFRKDGSSK